MDMLSMGGYGGYVWTSYGLTFIVVLVCLLQSRRRHRRIRDELTTRLAATEAGHGKAREKAGENTE
jgi:heme exporter protein D